MALPLKNPYSDGTDNVPGSTIITSPASNVAPPDPAPVNPVANPTPTPGPAPGLTSLQGAA